MESLVTGACDLELYCAFVCLRICAHAARAIRSQPNRTQKHEGGAVPLKTQQETRRRQAQPSLKNSGYHSHSGWPRVFKPCQTKRKTHQVHPLQLVCLPTSSKLDVCPPSKVTREIHAKQISCQKTRSCSTSPSKPPATLCPTSFTPNF